MISVDDHPMEPPYVFECRLPKTFETTGPRVEGTEEGRQVWMFEKTPHSRVGFMCAAGRAREDQRDRWRSRPSTPI